LTEGLSGAGFSLWGLVEARSHLLQQPPRLKPVLLRAAKLIRGGVGGGCGFDWCSVPETLGKPVKR
jgi:hypothetical protein